MKYWSEITNKKYDSIDALQKAQAEVVKAKAIADKKKIARESRAKEVEKAFKDAREAQKKAEKVLTNFCKDYGTFHTSLTENDINPFDSFLDWFLF